ncbi:MAG: calcium/sodium antiporter [Bacteroidales bacterium]|jgi:cation:H+ antiporter|nr:calcium/sodium antiporter [Bacteroidales bacterium]
MVLQILLLISGLLLILFGANWLVDGSTSIARKTGISEFVIGITIVGIGTSTPEMVVSYFAAFQGQSEIALGNVIGSNIFNILMILGITTLIKPVTMSRENRLKDIPMNILVTGALLILWLAHSILGIGQNQISRLEGLLMLIAFVAYLWMMFRSGNDNTEEENEEIKTFSPAMAVIMIIGGLACLIGGGRVFVNSATAIAHYLNLSEKFIAITIMAAGTSLPELATCIVAARKGRNQMALGNVIGSNISNILLIVGGAALISPLSLSGISYMDFAVVMISSIVLLISAYTFQKERIDRIEGMFFILIEIAYMVWLFIKG